MLGHRKVRGSSANSVVSERSERNMKLGILTVKHDQTGLPTSIAAGRGLMSKRNLAFLISAYVLLALIVLTSAKAASHRHFVNISGGHKHPIRDCSELHIQFDERDAVVQSEERTLTKSEAAVLQVHPHENGGVEVVGWDKETYSVTACKAAAGSGDAAERILSQITMS